MNIWKKAFSKKGPSLMALSVGVLVLGAAHPSPADTPFDQARAVVQQMLGEAITADAAARTPEAKGRAQERMGMAIATQALIDMDEPEKMYVAMQLIPFERDPGHVQEMLGEAIMDAAWAGTYREQSRSQEILGMLIANGTLLDLGLSPIGMGGDSESEKDRAFHEHAGP